MPCLLQWACWCHFQIEYWPWPDVHYKLRSFNSSVDPAPFCSCSDSCSWWWWRRWACCLLLLALLSLLLLPMMMLMLSSLLLLSLPVTIICCQLPVSTSMLYTTLHTWPLSLWKLVCGSNLANIYRTSIQDGLVGWTYQHWQNHRDWSLTNEKRQW